MAKKSYDEASVMRALGKKRAIKFNYQGSHVTIVVDTTSPEVGIGTYGKIDYLCNYKHDRVYTAMYVKPKKDSDKPSVKAPADKYNQDAEETTKTKRSGKLNLASMVKKVTTNRKYK